MRMNTREVRVGSRSAVSGCDGGIALNFVGVGGNLADLDRNDPKSNKKSGKIFDEV
jgi:hypothetical protein